MAAPSTHRITALLEKWTAGDGAALAELIPIVEGELRRLARRQMAGERADHVLQATALVNEAYIKLVDIRRMRWQNRAHFFAMAATVMRRVLVEEARARRNQKRGGDFRRATLDQNLAGAAGTPESLIELDEVMTALGREHPRQCRVMELRHFGGLSVEETAEVVGVSVETVMRDWKFAKVWLARALKPGSRS